MTPIVEPFEMRPNEFQRWLFGFLLALSVVGLVIASVENDIRHWWIVAAGMLLFGFGFWNSLTNKITANQQGIEITTPYKTWKIAWKDVTELKYHSVYHGHGMQLMLTITFGPKPQKYPLPVKQYPQKPMQRLFEIFLEQCPGAAMNDHFIKMAKGEMTWKDKLKMY